MPVRKEEGTYYVDFAELSKQWLPEEAVQEREKEAERKAFKSPAVFNYYEKRKAFFSQVGEKPLEWFKALLEFLDMHREASFKRGEREISLVEHTLRVADFAFALTGSLMPDERAVVVLAAIAHDLGKATVDSNTMKEHPEYSFEICKGIGMVSEEWDKVVKGEPNPLELQTIKIGNAASYLARYHHEGDIPAVDSFTADNTGMMKRLMVFLKKADNAAAKLESGEASSEAEAIGKAVKSIKPYEKKTERAAREIEVRNTLDKEKVGEKRVVQFLTLMAKGINQPADGRTAGKLYGYTMTTKPFVALLKNKTEDIAGRALGLPPDEVEETLKPFGPEDGKVLRACVFRAYPTAAGKREVCYVLNWDKVSKFITEQKEKLITRTNLERRGGNRALVSLIQE